MTQFLGRLLNRYFKLYFVLALLAFSILILLMNLPQAFGAEVVQNHNQLSSRLFPHVEVEEGAEDRLEKFYKWKVSPKTANAFEEKYVEFGGNQLFYKMRF